MLVFLQSHLRVFKWDVVDISSKYREGGAGLGFEFQVLSLGLDKCVLQYNLQQFQY